MKKIIIVGATSAIAEHCARIWARTPVELVLVGRDQGKLDLVSRDLKVRSPLSLVSTQITNFTDADAINTLVDSLNDKKIDIVLIAQGSLQSQELLQNDLTLCKQSLEINGLSPVIFAEAFASHMITTNSGTIAIIGSVAGDRGRKSNYVYGAAKGLIARYVEGMQHRFAKTGVKIVLVKPGPTDTPMTAFMKGQEGVKLASAQYVAQDIVNAVALKKKTIYTPGKWRLIMLIVRHVPSFLFNKIEI